MSCPFFGKQLKKTDAQEGRVAFRELALCRLGVVKLSRQVPQAWLFRPASLFVSIAGLPA